MSCKYLPYNFQEPRKRGFISLRIHYRINTFDISSCVTHWSDARTIMVDGRDASNNAVYVFPAHRHIELGLNSHTHIAYNVHIHLCAKISTKTFVFFYYTS